MMCLNRNKNFTNMQQVNCSVLSWSSENVPIYVFNNILFPAEGKPMRPTRASLDFMTSKPSFFSPPEAIKYSYIYFPFPLSSNSL